MIQIKEIHPLELKGERLILRPFIEQDLKDLQELWKDGQVMRYVGFPKGLPKSEEEMQKWFSELYANKSITESDYYLAVTDLAGRFLGEAMIGKVENGTSEPDAKLLPIYWGKGYAKEVFNLIIDYTFNHLTATSIKVTPNVLNERAIRLYHSLGFIKQGESDTWFPPEHLENIAQPVQYQTMVLTSKNYVK